MGKSIVKIACCIFVLLPLLISLGVIVSNGIPDGLMDGDGALMGVAIDSAAHFQHLTGLSSRFGFNHPGPLYFYLLWPLYHFTHYCSFSLDVTATLLNLAFIGGILLLIQRYCHNLMLVSWFALLLVQYLRYLGPIAMNFWTPCAPMLGFWYGVLCFVAVAYGNPNYLPLAVMSLSFVVQTHFGYAPAFGMTMLLALLCLCSPHGRRLFRGTPDQPKKFLPSLIGSLFIVIILWMPPLIEQFSPEGGNMTKIVQFFHEQQATRSWHEAYLLSTKIFSNYLLSWFRPVNPWQLFEIPAGVSQGIFWGQVGLLGVAYVIAKRQKHAFLQILAVFVIFWHLVLIISVQRIIGEVFDYLVIWMAGIGLFSWFVIGAALMSLGTPKVPSQFAKYLERLLVLALLAGMGFITFNATKALRQETLDTLKYRNVRTATPDFHKIVKTAFETLEKYHAQSCLLTLLDNDIWPSSAGLAVEFLKTDIALTLNPRFPPNSYSRAYIPTSIPDGQFVLANKATAAKLSALKSLLPIQETPTVRMFWRTFSEPLAGTYLFEFLPLCSLRNEGFSNTGYNSLGESFRWSSATRSSLSLPLKQGRDYLITFSMSIPRQVPKISVLVNHRQLTEFDFEKWEWREFSVTIPRAIITTQPTALTFQYHYTEPPKLPFQEGRNGNAVAFRTITFTPSTAIAE